MQCRHFKCEHWNRTLWASRRRELSATASPGQNGSLTNGHTHLAACSASQMTRIPEKRRPAFPETWTARKRVVPRPETGVSKYLVLITSVNSVLALSDKKYPIPQAIHLHIFQFSKTRNLGQNFLKQLGAAPIILGDLCFFLYKIQAILNPACVNSASFFRENSV